MNIAESIAGTTRLNEAWSEDDILNAILGCCSGEDGMDKLRSGLKAVVKKGKLRQLYKHVSGQEAPGAEESDSSDEGDAPEGEGSGEEASIASSMIGDDGGAEDAAEEDKV